MACRQSSRLIINLEKKAPTVATYIGDVNQFSLDTYIPQLFDVERIEVLRGFLWNAIQQKCYGGVILKCNYSIGEYRRKFFLRRDKELCVQHRKRWYISGLYN